MGADSLNGKLKCADCGTTLLKIRATHRSTTSFGARGA